MFYATALAVLGGLLWSFGVLGKRIGVHAAPPEAEGIRATCTIFVYTLTTLIPPLVDFLGTDPALIHRTLADEAWTARAPGIAACGLVAGLGGVLGTMAFAVAGASSALISMVENGVYTVAGAVLIAVCFGEHLALIEYVSAALIMVGILLAQSGGKKRSEGFDESPPVPVLTGSPSHISGLSTPRLRRSLLSSVRSAGEQQPPAADAAAVETAPPAKLSGAAITLAIAGGLCWGAGPVGKKYGVADAPLGQERVRTTCTYLLYMACTGLVPVLKMLSADAGLRRATLRDPDFRRLMCGTVACGLTSGAGGIVSTLAFVQGANHSALVSMIENGVYTVSGALLIAMVFKERPTKRQLCSSALVLAGLVTSAAA